jgi:hypothetical protein
MLLGTADFRAIDHEQADALWYGSSWLNSDMMLHGFDYNLQGWRVHCIVQGASWCYKTIWSAVWVGLVWSAVWFGLVWFGLVWFGLVWVGLSGLLVGAVGVCSIEPVDNLVAILVNVLQG